MNSEILAVGTELLMGQIANTNAQFISSRLADIGVNVYYHSVVGDNPGRLKEALGIAMRRSDLVIVTGGLGPTKDDLTKETIASELGLRLLLHHDILSSMESFFANLGRKMTENNIKQAYLPEGCTIVSNPNGTAPGCIIEKDDKIIIMLPGPPREMKDMMEQTVLPFLAAKSGVKLYSRYIRIFGIGESMVEDMISDLVDSQTDPTIAPYAKDGEVTLRVTSGASSEEQATANIMPVVNEIRKRLGDSVYSIDNENLHEVAGGLLMQKNMSLSVAESCTGGMISARLTDIPGISAIFDRGIVSYSNASKINHLGVNPATMEKYGAVSRETALEMALGIKRVSGSDIGLSITGIAGPGGGSAEKPVGTVYLGIAGINGYEDCKQLKLWGSRDRIRYVACLNAFDILRRYVWGLSVDRN